MKRLVMLVTGCALAAALATAHAQFSPVQLVEVKPTTKKKNLSSGAGNVANFQEIRTLTITIRNATAQPVSAVTVRWGVVKADFATSQTVAYGEEETLDLRPSETRVIETAAIIAGGTRWNYRAAQGEKIMGHGVQLLLAGRVVAEEFSPPSVKSSFQTLKPVEGAPAAPAVATTSVPRTTPAPTPPPATTIPAPAPVVGRLPSAGARTTTPGQGTGPTTMSAGPEKTMKTSTGMELVWIPPGEFMLGSTKEERGNAKYEGEEPRKTKIADGFWLGRTELTVGQWKQFVNATGFVTDDEKAGESSARKPDGHMGQVKGANWQDPKFGFKPKDNHPVCCVSWNDAMAFCQWLTEKERKANKLPTGLVYRLPTEAEWEYACRAGTQTKFWWGETAKGGERRLNWLGTEDGYEFVSPVDHYGVRGRNKFGLADMLGNVREWCLDGWDSSGAPAEYSSSNQSGCTARGGTFMTAPEGARCAARVPLRRSGSGWYNGFRVCCGVPR